MKLNQSKVLLCTLLGTSWFIQSTRALSTCLRRAADEVIAVFENGKTTIRYDYCEDISDGRGYTFGRAGFVTKYDALDVLDELSKGIYNGVGKDFINSYKSALENVKGTDDTTGLDGFCDDVKYLASFSEFRQAQDAVVDKLYYNPAMVLCEKYNLSLPLSKLMIYESNIRHGDSTDPSYPSYNQGISRMMARVEEEKNIPTPNSKESEMSWLSAFVEIRQKAMREMAYINEGDDQFLDGRLDDGTRYSYRVDFYRQQIEIHQNFEMLKNLHIVEHHDTIVLGCGETTPGDNNGSQESGSQSTTTEAPNANGSGSQSSTTEAPNANGNGSQSSTTEAPNSTCVAFYDECTDENKSCAIGSSCVYMNDYYSQCIPDEGTSPYSLNCVEESDSCPNGWYCNKQDDNKWWAGCLPLEELSC